MAQADGTAPGDAQPALDALLRVVRTIRVGQAFHTRAETDLLQAVVVAAVMLFDAQAASIALLEREPDRLEYRVAAGPHGEGVIGLSIPVAQGVAGYAFSSGEPLSLSDVSADLRPRDRRPHRLRAAEHRGGPARRRRRAGRGPPGPRQGRLVELRAP